MKMQIVKIFTLFFFCSYSVAIEPNEFGYAAEIQLPPQANTGFYRLPLPLAVYEHIASRKLTDIRLVDADNRSVHFDIISPDQYTETQENLYFEPLSRGLEHLKKTVNTDNHAKHYIEQSREEKVGDATLTLTDIVEEEKNDSAYIALNPLNAHASEGFFVKKLIINLNSSAANFLLGARLYSSNDLVNWSSVDNNALHMLGEISIGTGKNRQTAIQNEIVLEKNIRDKYLIVVFNESPIDFKLSMTYFLTQVSAQPTQWFKTTATLNESQKEDHIYTLHKPPIFVQKMRLSDREENTNYFYNIDLYSSNVMNTRHWIYVRSLQSYHFVSDAKSIANEASIFGNDRVVQESESRAPYWKLMINSYGATLADAIHFELGWQPDTVIFMAAGRPPYRLLFGNADLEFSDEGVGNLAHHLNNVIDVKSEKSVSTLGEMKTLAGEKALHPTFHWNSKKIVLWFVLLTGIAGMLWMVISLFRQMKKP